MTTRVLGIDPGLQNVGWGVVEEVSGRAKRVDSGLIKTSKRPAEIDRLLQISEDLKVIIKHAKPKVLAYEQTYYTEGIPTMAKIYRATGAIMLTAAQMGLLTVSYPPQVIKKAICGTGKASKDQMGRYVNAILETNLRAGEHEIDALAVAICRAHRATLEDIGVR